MNYQLIAIVRNILDDDQIKKVYFHTRGNPVSFAVVIKFMEIEKISQLIDQNKSNAQIAEKMRCCERTIKRWRKAILKNKSLRAALKK